MDKNILTNRFCGVLVCAAMLFVGQSFAAWDGSISEVAPNTEVIDGKTFYLIENEAELAWFANETNKNPGARLDINAKLIADLDMNHKLWTPMAAGKGDVVFQGIIDGDNHVISNLYINSDEIAQIKPVYAQNLGFVGVLGSGAVKNIVFENVDIVTSTDAGSILSSKANQISVGAVVGWLAEKTPGGVVSACYVSGNISATGNGQGIGGIVGNGKNGTIEHCMSAVSILAEGDNAYVGGIIGITKATLSVNSCVYDGEGLTNLGNGATGAVVGNHLSGTLTTSNNYYDDDLKGVGLGTETGNSNNMVDLVNAEDIACALNGGEMLDGYCTIASPWSVGENRLALNGYGAAPISILSVKVTQYGAVTITEYPDKTVAEIDGNYTGSDAVEIDHDIEVNSVTLNRTFNKNQISTLMLPFEIDASLVNGAKVYKFKTVVMNEEDGRWKFKVAKTEIVKPNTPYVVLPSASQVTFEIAEPVIFNTTTEGLETSSDGWEFNGVYAYTTFKLDEDNPIYLFANQECDGAKLGEFVKIADGAFTKPLRAYLLYHKNKALMKSVLGGLDGNNALLPDELDIEIEDENGFVVETGRINTVTGEFRMDSWFDLKGRKLNSKPSVKGTYYKNGKKVIVK